LRTIWRIHSEDGTELNATTSFAPTSSRFLSGVLIILALSTIAVFFIPAFIIRPFAYQSPRGLLLAMAIRQRGPIISLMLAIASLLVAAVVWQNAKKWARIAVIVLMLFVAFSAVMTRLNYFEWMFHPVDAPRFEAESASKLDKGEMILAVRYGSDSRAYPIREMAYHHILNDVVESVPIAVTY
jgi:Protein of unknown function (DUF3179)